MPNSSAGTPYAIAIAAGAATWLAASLVTGKREAWDAGLYWALALFFAQCLAMALRNGEIGNLFPLGLFMFGVLSLPAVAAANFGARLKKGREN